MLRAAVLVCLVATAARAARAAAADSAASAAADAAADSAASAAADSAASAAAAAAADSAASAAAADSAASSAAVADAAADSAASSAALADAAALEDAAAERATDIVGRPIVLAAGRVAVELTLEINIAHNYWAEPLSLAPDLWWGATSRLTLGVVHSNASVDRFAPGASVCLTQDPLYCDSPYRGGGLDARYLVLERDGLALAPRARLLARDLDPFKPALTLGAVARWTRGRWAIRTDPYIQIALANSELGNRSALFIPLHLAVQPTCRWQIALDSGWNSVLAVIEDGWHIPIALGVRARATSHVDLGATLGFASLLGPQNTPKQRVLFLSLAWRN